ncbi:ExeA family protein [Pseudoduganella rivuli]|nr:AAA family ATPase [Pseudoduganella rivuli]
MEQPGYLAHFRLRSAPFGTAPDAALFYAEGARRELLGALAYAVTHGDGIVKITGDAGSGMTLLCHALARQLAGQAVIIHMEPGSLGPLGVIHATALALGLNPDGKRSDEVLRELQSHLAAMRAGGRHAVLMADHADLLPSEALEEIRLLTNLDDTDGKLLQIVLLGQHALNASLRQHAMRQFRERITLSFVMPQLAADDVPALLAHRLHAAGYDGLDMFASDAVRMLASTAKGDLRRLIQLADQTLAAAASEGAVSVSVRHVQAAIRGRLPALKPRGNVRPVVIGSITVIAAIGIGAVVLLQQAQRRPAAASLPMHTGVIKSAAPMALATAGTTGTATTNPQSTPAIAASTAPSAPASATALPTTSSADARPDAANANAVADKQPPTASLLQQTLKAGKTWLRDEPDTHFSIKIEDFAASDTARAEAFLNDVRNVVGIGDVHAYPTLNKGEPRIGIAYGSYGTEQQALKAMAALNGRWRYAPKIRNIGAIRAAVARATKTQPRALQ